MRFLTKSFSKFEGWLVCFILTHYKDSFWVVFLHFLSQMGGGRFFFNRGGFVWNQIRLELNSGTETREGGVFR